MRDTTIGIIGAGKLGITLARIARHHGYDVVIAGSGDPSKIALTAEVLAPGTKAMSTEDVARTADVILLALPLSKFTSLPADAFTGKLVIDAMNYWWEVDGSRDDVVPTGQSSSEAVQQYLQNSRVVKAFNHVGYHDLFDSHTEYNPALKKAIAMAGDDKNDKRIVARIISDFGFVPYDIGGLSNGRMLEAGTPVFGVSVTLPELKSLIDLHSAAELA